MQAVLWSAAAAALLTMLYRRYRERQAETAGPLAAAHPPEADAVQRELALTKPPALLSRGQRLLRGGAKVLAAHAEAAMARSTPGWGAAGSLRLMGIDFTAWDFLVRLVLFLGLSGTGKTAAMIGAMREAMRLLFGGEPVALRTQLVVIDPVGAFRGEVFANTPHGVPIHDLSLDAAGGMFWDIARDLETGADVTRFLERLKGDRYKKGGDEFWNTIPTAYLAHVVAALMATQTRTWRVSSLVRAVLFPDFAEEMVKTLPAGRAFFESLSSDDKKLKREVALSGGGMLRPLTAAAEYEQLATEGLSMREFLACERGVLFAQVPFKALEGGGALMGAMLDCLTGLILSRQVARGEQVTYFVLDEAASLGTLGFIKDIAGRGRQHGAGVLMSVLTIPVFAEAFGEAGAKAICSLPRIQVCFACDGETASYFSKLCGTQEVVSTETSEGTSATYTSGHGGGKGGSNWTESWASGTTTTVSTKVGTQDVLLPSELTNLPTPDSHFSPGRSWAYAFVADLGSFLVTMDIASEAERRGGTPAWPAPPARTPKDLLPFTADELAALGFNPGSEGFQDALAAYL